MIKLLIYGRGIEYRKIKRLIDWKNVLLEAFIDSFVSEDVIEYTDENIKIIHPSQIAKQEYDYILCASTYEDEMRGTLREMNVPEEKILSGMLNWENILDNSFLFDLSCVQIYQNGQIDQMSNQIKERNRFYDIRQGLPWIEEKISIIGDNAWAVGYDYLSVLSRVLQIIEPQNILEMGLGQSSKILMSYAKYHTCNLKIIEQDGEWYNTFKKENRDLDNNAQVIIKPIKKVYNKKYDVDVVCYTDISDVIANEKYNVISIDGPWGTDGISRVDILSYIPDCLNESWCIMLDDYEREGEKNMIYELENILKKRNVRYRKKIYGKYRQFCLLTSEPNKFLCSLF